MRTLSLVECVELSFSGSVLQNAICFGDCDNDGLNEFVLGSTEGELSIFRDNKCICKSVDLGTLSAVAVGDLLNTRRNVLVAVTVEGWCHVFDVEHELQHQEKNVEEEAESDTIPQFSTSDCFIFPFHSQRIPPNTKVLHLADVNGDGLLEMVVGLTDRVLRTYQWKLEVWEESLGSSALSKEDITHENLLNDIYDGRLVALNKWEFANQIGSVAIHRRGELVSILVGHPGANLTQITESHRRRRRSTAVSLGLEQNKVMSSATTISSEASTCTPSTSASFQAVRKESEPSSSDNIVIEHYDLNKNKIMSPNITTQLIGNIMPSAKIDDGSYALASIDGTIVIAKEDKIQWKTQLPAIFLSLSQLDGKILVCSGNGEIFIVDPQEQEQTLFCFEDSVAAFDVGIYGISETRKFSKLSSESSTDLKNRKSFACVTFHQKAYIYPIDVLKL